MIGPQQRTAALGTPATSTKTPLRRATSRRSPAYLDALRRLDGQAVLSPIDVSRIVETFHHEFAEKWAQQPLGWVAHCYLGPPYEAHTLLPGGVIVEHYEVGRPFPEPLERARKLTRSETYIAIEVYVDRLLCISPDGSAVTVEE
jgi:hypothetical protein